MEKSLYLPPGFRFHPTDEEIITHYLLEKITDRNFSSIAVVEANFNDCEPWDLPGKAKMGENGWFFFCQKDRKYPTGMRTNRATESGYWKATGKDKEIFKGKGVLVGMKKTLVFYMGRAPKGKKSNWVMHEYRLEGKHKEPYNLYKSPHVQDEWVVCKLYHKIKDTKASPTQELAARMNSFVDDLFVENTTLPPFLMDSTSYFNSSNAEAHDTKYQQNEFSQSIFSSQSHPEGNFFLHLEEEIMREPLNSDQANLFSLKGGNVKKEHASNSIACTSQDTGLSTERNIAETSSAVSKQHIGGLHAYFDDIPLALQALDFDSILNYEFV